MRWRPLATVAAVLVALALVVIGALIAFQDLSVGAVRRLAVQRLEAITDREVSIAGDFDLVPSLMPTLAAEGLVVANADWGSGPAMLDAERVEVELQLLPLLLRRDVVIDRLGLVGAEVLLERGPDGQVNWEFDATAPAPAERRREFLLNEVAVEDSRVTWHDAASDRSETVRVEQLVWQADAATDRLALSGAGEFREHAFTLAGELGSIATLRESEEPYPLGLAITVEDLEVTLEGQLSPEREAQLSVQAAGPGLAALGDLVGRELPELGAYEVQGELTGSIEQLALGDIAGAIGAEDVPRIRITGGQIEDVLAGDGIRLRVAAAGDELARLAEAFGTEMAPFGPYQFEGTLVGSFESLALQNASAAAGDRGTRIEVTGAVENALALSGFDLATTVEGQSFAELSPIAGVDLPSSAPYRIMGEVSGSIVDLRIDDLAVELADSTFGGWLAVHRLETGTPRVEGQLNADRLDLDRILALADRAGAEEAEAEQAPAQEPAPGDGQIFPAAPLPLRALEKIQADLVLRADEVMLDATEFAGASLNLVLQDGRLSVHDLALHVDGGKVAGDAAVEPEAGAAEVTVRLSANDIPVGDLLRDFGATEKVLGEVDIDVNIDSTGRSIDELMAELEGSAAVVAEEGRIEDNQLHRLVADLDILSTLPPFWQREKAVRVNCLIGEFDIEDGVAQTGAMLDTQRMTLLGEGTVDLGEETFDLELRPLPKTRKLSTLAVPLDIEGTFREPAIRLRTGTAVAQAARGVLGGLLIPLNQITALFGQETADACADALRQAQERREQLATESRSPT